MRGALRRGARHACARWASCGALRPSAVLSVGRVRRPARSRSPRRSSACPSPCSSRTASWASPTASSRPSPSARTSPGTSAAARFRRRRARVSACPLRRGFAPRAVRPRGTRARVLVMGGSQGAAALNERMPEALALALGGVPGLEVLHQAGRDRDARRARGATRARASTRVTVVPFIDDVAARDRRARTSSSPAPARPPSPRSRPSAAPRSSCRSPTPPTTTRRENAEALARAGGARVHAPGARPTPARLAAEIGRLLGDDARSRAMADASRALRQARRRPRRRRATCSTSPASRARPRGATNGTSHRRRPRQEAR